MGDCLGASGAAGMSPGFGEIGCCQICPPHWWLYISQVSIPGIAPPRAYKLDKETLEILLTHPIRDRELILGKFFSAFAYMG